MNLGDLILQNFFGIVASVIGAVFSWLALRFLRGIRTSTEETEKHARETSERLSQLDRVSLTTHDAALEQWQHDMATRIEGLAESKSDTLAWQANNDRRFAGIEQRLKAAEKFMWELDAYAHGTGPVPLFTPEETYSTGTHALEGAIHDQH